MKNKIMITILALSLLFSLAACGAESERNDSESGFNPANVDSWEEQNYAYEKIDLPDALNIIEDFCITTEYIYVIGENKTGSVLTRSSFLTNEWEIVEITDLSYNFEYIISRDEEAYILAIKDGNYSIITVGNEIQIVNTNLPEDKRFSGLIALNDGILLWNYSEIFKIDAINGRSICHKELSDTITLNEICSSQESVYAQLNCAGTQKLIEIGSLLSGKDNYIELQSNAIVPVSMSKSPYILIGNLDSLIRVDVKKGTEQTVISWTDAGIGAADLIPKLTEQSDGTIFFADLYTDSIYRITPAKEDKRTEIVIATAGVGPQLSSVISDFNNTNTEYKISAKIYNMNELDRLRTEIMAGNGPDIVDLFSFPLAGEHIGIYENLIPYIENDSEVSERDFIPNIFEAAKNNDALYYVIPTFKVCTAVSGNPEISGSVGNTFDEYIDNLSSAGTTKATEIFGDNLSPADILQAALPIVFQEAIINNSGRLSIDEEVLEKYILFAENKEGYDVIFKEISNYRQINSLLNSFHETLNYVGYPSDKTNGSYAEPSFICFAMLSSSEHKTAAWDFLRIFLSSDYQDKYTENWGFPTRLDSFEKYLSKAEHDNEMNLNHKNIKGLKEFIESIDVFNFYEKQLENIVIEEAKLFYDGSRTLDAAVKNISSKANIYLSEQFG